MSLFTTVVYSASSADAVVNTIVPKIVGNIVIPLIELLFAVATVVFIWGLFGFFRGGDDAEARKVSRDHILWGVVGFFIMVSVYGIIRFVAATVGQSSALPF